jgi:hypothetical protein
MQHPPDGRKIMGGQGHDAGKVYQRGRALRSGCIGSQESEAAGPSGFADASRSTENTRMLLPIRQSWMKILSVSGCTIASTPHGHAATRAQPPPANRQSAMGSGGCPDPPPPRRHENPSVPSAAGTSGPRAKSLSRHSWCIESRGSIGSAREKRCFAVYRRESGQRARALS